jgi:Tol biopolymer transport system component
MRPDGTGVRQITSGHGDDREPRFSPEGTKIAFASDRAFNGSYDIWVVDLASNALTQWTNTGGVTTPPTPASVDEFEPTWSPDGQKIAFVVRRNRHHHPGARRSRDADSARHGRPRHARELAVVFSLRHAGRLPAVRQQQEQPDGQ